MQGWECPRCGKCYAPHVDECKQCNGTEEAQPAALLPYLPFLGQYPIWVIPLDYSEKLHRPTVTYTATNTGALWHDTITASQSTAGAS